MTSDQAGVRDMSEGSWPEGMEMIRQAREALGLFAGAMPVTPQQAWEEALERMRGLAEGRCWLCMEKDAGRAESSRCGGCGSAWLVLRCADCGTRHG